MWMHAIYFITFSTWLRALSSLVYAKYGKDKVSHFVHASALLNQAYRFVSEGGSLPRLQLVVGTHLLISEGWRAELAHEDYCH